MHYFLTGLLGPWAAAFNGAREDIPDLLLGARALD